MAIELKCEKRVRIDDGRDQQGRRLFHHERCNAPAMECELSGLLTTAKSILCAKHKAQAEHECFISANGFRKDQVSKEAKANHYRQTPFSLK